MATVHETIKAELEAVGLDVAICDACEIEVSVPGHQTTEAQQAILEAHGFRKVRRGFHLELAAYTPPARGKTIEDAERIDALCGGNAHANRWHEEHARVAAPAPEIIEVQTLTAKEAAAKYGKSLSTIYRWLAAGKLTGHKVNGKWVIEVAKEF